MARKDNHPKARPVIVRWIDSMGQSGWNDPTPSKMECTSVGNLIKRDKESVVLSLNKSHYGTGDHIEIPAIAVKSVKRLKE